MAECHGAGENRSLRSSKRRSRFARCYEFDSDRMPFDLLELRLHDLRQADRASASFKKNRCVRLTCSRWVFQNDLERDNRLA